MFVIIIILHYITYLCMLLCVIIINPRRACAARVTVVVLCVCMYVCVCVCVHSYLLPHTLESQKRDTNGFCAIQGSFLILPIFLKMLRSKVTV